MTATSPQRRLTRSVPRTGGRREAPGSHPTPTPSWPPPSQSFIVFTHCTIQFCQRAGKLVCMQTCNLHRPCKRGRVPQLWLSMPIGVLMCTLLHAQITNFGNWNLFDAIVKRFHMVFKSHTKLSKIFFFYCMLLLKFSICKHIHETSWASLAKLTVYYLFLFSPSACLQNWHPENYTFQSMLIHRLENVTPQRLLTIQKVLQQNSHWIRTTTITWPKISWFQIVCIRPTSSVKT